MNPELSLTVINHPLVSDKIARLRNENTKPEQFRSLCQEITVLAAYEALRDLKTIQTRVQTPLVETDAEMLAAPPTVVGILRAGLIMIEAILSLVPEAPVGHIGLFRDPESLKPVEYYSKLPPDIAERDVVLVDPMLATGGSANNALGLLKDTGAQRIQLISIIGCPEGVSAVQTAHPEVPITLAALDDHLDSHAYIVPGLGDAGDRIFGTS